jgi:hypothetical protein
MKSRAFVLVVLVFACLLAAGSASAETCRYICGGTILQGSATHCCGTPFQCPNGQTVYPYAYYNGSWRFCGSTATATSELGGAGAASLPDWAASEDVPVLTEGAKPPASAGGTSSATPSDAALRQRACLGT